jgi:hypothetical protein
VVVRRRWRGRSCGRRVEQTGLLAELLVASHGLALRWMIA